MNTAVPLTDPLNLRQRLNQGQQRLLPLWTRYWPLVLMAIGLIWLITALVSNPLENRITHYYETVERTIKLTPLIQSRLINRVSKEYWAGVRAGALLGIFLNVILPYLLILSGLGHYQYWYVTRPILLTPGRAAKWGYGVVLLLVWFILLGMAITSFGKQTVLAGGIAIFPTLTVGYLLTYALLIHFRERQREERDLAQARRQAELDALKAQVNPPLLFHALQGLHETAVAENLPRTTESLAQLTGIMQYVLEESRNQTTDITREIGFIRDYLRLQQLRLPDRATIRITTEIDWDQKPAHIVPLLLNPLIENAFKHGISMHLPCFVTVRFRVTDNVLLFTTENSILPRNDLERGTGLGLKNVRRRLALAYPDRHKLTLTDNDGVYRVDLKIKLH